MKPISLQKLLCLMLLGFFYLSALTQSVLAATITVSNTNDSGAGSLRQAIANAAQTNDVIVFAPGVTGTITLTSGELFFTKSLTINGPGATNLTISGNNASRVFSVSSGTIMISGLRIANGFVTGNPNSHNAGGGIYNNSSKLTVRNCEIANNVHAGGPNTSGFPITGQGGGVWHISGGDAISGGRLLLQNCLFSGNMAVGGSGTESTLPNGNGGDAAPGQGGGLFIFPTSANSVTIEDCTFMNNSAAGGTGGNGMGTGVRGRGGRGQGGAVFVGENTLLVAQRCTFKRNEANGGSRGAGSNTPGGGNTAQGQGGAIYVNGFAVINDCTLDDNEATGGPGIDGTALIGAQGQGGGLFFGFGVVYLARSTIINNVAEGGAGGLGATGAGEGGGLYVRFNGNQFRLHLINSTVALNIARAGNTTAPASGGGIWTEDFLHVTNSTIAFNVVLGDASVSGGGLHVNGGTTTLRNTLIAKNIADAVPSDANGAVASSSGYNLIGVGSGVGTTVTGISHGVNNNQIGTSAAPIDPKMHAPLLQGGLTMTCSIDADSPAVNAGDSATAPVSDQRGFLRSGVSDIGAFELGGAAPASLQILSITKIGNGTTVLQGFGVPNGVHRIQASSDLSPGSFFDLPPTATADAAGLLQYQDTATNLTKRFYRLAFP